ncbi:MAG: nucleotidyltransferase domain-containing protein [Candidatus Aenigmatarchaeota archaeon]
MEEKIKKALKDFSEECKKKFKNNLISIVFFGSRVKNLARKDSDYDILIIAKNLPDIKERFDLISDLESKIFEKYAIKISSILVEP